MYYQSTRCSTDVLLAKSTFLLYHLCDQQRLQRSKVENWLKVYILPLSPLFQPPISSTYHMYLACTNQGALSYYISLLVLFYARGMTSEMGTYLPKPIYSQQTSSFLICLYSMKPHLEPMVNALTKVNERMCYHSLLDNKKLLLGQKRALY